jgi:integrase
MVVVNDRAQARSRLDRLLQVSTSCRLHLAIVLIGRLKVPADLTLDLRWSQVDLGEGVLLTGQGTWTLPEPVVELIGWHAAHQRLDAWRTPRWPDTGRVFVNAYGAPINAEQANATVAYYCKAAGLPVVPLAGLRHPSWCGV